MTEHKSEFIKQVALANGWKAEVVTDVDEFQISGDIRDIIWHVYAMRGRETMHVTYIGDLFEKGIYKYGAQVAHLSWRYRVMKFITGQPDPKKFIRNNEPALAEDAIARNVPWERDTPAIDILLEVMKKEITWVRKFDGQVCTAVVDVNLKERGSAKHFRVYESKTGRVLEWADALGFHAVALGQIIDVS